MRDQPPGFAQKSSGPSDADPAVASAESQVDDRCVVCALSPTRHGGLCCSHRYDEQPRCTECPPESAAPLMCGNEHGRPKRAVFRVTWPGGRFNPSAACLSCARNWIVPQAFDERQPVLLEVVNGA